MKYIVAIIQPSKLDDVRDALSAKGVIGMTASEVKGYGRQKGHKEVYRGAEYQLNFVPKVKIEIAIPQTKLEEVLLCLADAAKTSQIGDGKIFVFDLEQTIRVRTGETGEDAL